jgi:hypothetical protein
MFCSLHVGNVHSFVFRHTRPLRSALDKPRFTSLSTLDMSGRVYEAWKLGRKLEPNSMATKLPPTRRRLKVEEVR